MRNPQSSASYSDGLGINVEGSNNVFLLKILMSINDNLALIADNLDFMNSDLESRLNEISMALNEIASK
jgi:hypothetical protein